MGYLRQKGTELLLFAIGIVLLSPLSAQEQSLPWKDDFSDDTMVGWTVVDREPGAEQNWRVLQKGLWYISPTTPEATHPGEHESWVVAGSSQWKDYTLQVTARPWGEDKGYGVLFCYQDARNHYRYVMHKDPVRKKSYRRVEKVVRGEAKTLWQDRYEQLATDATAQQVIRVALKDGKISVANDLGQLCLLTDDTFTSGKIGLYCIAANKYSFDDVSVYPTESLDMPFFKNGPYLQNVCRDRITIMWETARPADSRVDYGLTPELGKSLYESRKTLIHEVTLTGLKRETRYHYRVISDGEASEVSTFRTAINQETPFRLVVYGDTRTDVASHKKVVEGILREKPDLVIHVGDVVTNGQNYEEWNREFLVPAGPLMRSTPLYVAIGNHERNAHWYYDYVSFPAPENYYSFDYGNTHFIVLDTNLYTPYQVGSVQHQWLENELRSAKARRATWVLVFAHQPPYSEGWDSPLYDGEWDMRDALVPLFERYGVDIMFAGHTHDYERGTLSGVTYVITGGGGAPLDHREQDWSHITQYASCYQFCVVDIQGDTLRFQAKQPDGTLIDSFQLTAKP
jgi:predicted phosphodiesterase